MSGPSPTCTINSGSTPANVSAGSTVNGALANPSGALYWFLSAISTDETNTAAAINATLSLNQTDKTFSFTAPEGLGSAVIFMSTVGISSLSALGAGRDANDQIQPTYTTTFKVNVAMANGATVIAANEVTEQSSTAGWVANQNAAIRLSASAAQINQDLITLANPTGLNSDIEMPAPNLSSVRIQGATGAVILGGFKPYPGQSWGAGQPLDVQVLTDDAVTIRNADASSTSTNRITTPTGQDVLLPPGQTPQCRFVYDGTTGKLVLQGTFHSVAVVNVKDFGATGNGTTDDTAALNAAMTYAATTYFTDPVTGNQSGGIRLFFPAGIYCVSSSIVLPATGEANLVIEGAGEGATIIKGTVGGIWLLSQQYGNNVAQAGFVRVRHITFQSAVPVSTWQANHSYSAGQYVTSGQSNLIWRCTTSGTSGSYMPYGYLSCGLGYAGTTTPQVFLTGAPAASYERITLAITAGGARGTATFQYSTNGGQSYNGTNIATAATVALGATGLTANFATGTYVAYTSGLNDPGYYATPVPGYGMSGIRGTTITESTGVAWTACEGGGILQYNGGEWHIEDCTFNGNLPVAVCYDGTEIAFVRRCAFYSLNGVWLTGGNIRLNGTSDPSNGGVSNASYICDCQFSCPQLNIATEGNEGLSITNCNFESGVFYVWLFSAGLVRISTLLTEGGASGFFIGGMSAFAGFMGDPSYNIRCTDSLIESGTGAAIQFCPIASAPTYALSTSAVSVSFEDCELTGHTYCFSGVSNVNGLYRVNVSTSAGTSVFADSIYEQIVLDASNNFVRPGIGVGIDSPTASFDTALGYVARTYGLVLENGMNSAVSGANTSFVNISGPTEAFQLSGFSDGVDGLEREGFNSSGQTMTLKHQDSTDEPTAANRLVSPTGADLVCITFRMRYSGSGSTGRWYILAYSVA